MNWKHAKGVEDGHGCAHQPATSHTLGIDILENPPYVDGGKTLIDEGKTHERIQMSEINVYSVKGDLSDGGNGG